MPVCRIHLDLRRTVTGGGVGLSSSSRVSGRSGSLKACLLSPATAQMESIQQGLDPRCLDLPAQAQTSPVLSPILHPILPASEPPHPKPMRPSKQDPESPPA